MPRIREPGKGLHGLAQQVILCPRIGTGQLGVHAQPNEDLVSRREIVERTQSIL